MNENTANVVIVGMLAAWGAIASIAHAWRDRGRQICPRCKAILDDRQARADDKAIGT
jgi:hypothetical protein